MKPEIAEVLLLTNGPGELSTWVPPVLSRLRRALPKARYELFLIRDQFAAGTEASKAKALELDALSGLSALLLRMAERKPKGRGLVLMLGGNPSQAVSLGKALDYPAFAYSFDAKAWREGLSGFLVDSERTYRAALSRGARPERTKAVGNLVVDALTDTPPVASSPADVLLFPSSRPYIARHLLGFMLGAAEAMHQQQPELRFAWVKSRLLPHTVVEEALLAKAVRDIGGVSAMRKGDLITTEGGLEVAVLDESERYAAMQGAKVALTIPGTNTLEMGLAGLPAVVMLPLHKPELIPLEGILHWVFAVPGLRSFKQAAVRRYLASLPHLALPNQWLDERVYPELVGIFSPQAVAQTALELIPRKAEIAARLHKLQAQPGADNLVEYVLSAVQKS